ncbi:MAG: helix-turn-helix transcriptional regulator [Oscillospiraceae bacterium]
MQTEKKLTQAQLAEKLGVSDKSISRWETGVSHR